MKHLALILFFAVSAWAQFPPVSPKINVEIDDVPAGIAKTLSLIPGSGVSMSGSCAGGKCTITINSTVVGEGGGDVVGPAASVDGEAAVYSGITGKLLKRFNGTGLGLFSSGVLSVDSGLQFNGTTKSLGVFGPIVSGQTSNYLGQILLNGITSGTVTIRPADAAGTWTLTLPANDGDSGQALVTNGSGVASWASNVPTATALAANGANCSSGQAALGVDASGAAEGCWSVPVGDVVGPASSVNGEVAIFDGETGKLVKRMTGTGLGLLTSGVMSVDSGLQFNGSTKALGVFGPIISGQTSNYLGQFVLNGITSGAVTIQPANAAGTWTLTLPTNDGDNGQVLTTNGSGVTSWTTPSGSGDMSNPMTTAQDIIVGGTSGAPGRLGVGGEGTVLKVVSGSVAWGTDSTGGSPAFSDVAAGTNTNALVVGTGGSLGVSGSGSIVATALNAQYLDWSASSGGNSIANKPTLGALAAAAYPGAGVPISTGSAWGTSLTAPAGDLVGTTATQILTGKTLTLPIIGSYTVAGLPAAGTAGRVAAVTDASAAGSCTSGGGSNLAFCRDSGSAWVPIGDGGSGGGTGDVTAAVAFGADNLVVRSDGTGKGVQATGCSIDDGNILTCPGGFIGSISGNAGTATALAANGANCSAGQAPLGVNSSGAVESCFAVASPTSPTLSDPVFTGSAQIPNGASLTIDAAGEIAVDTTSDQLTFHGAARRALPSIQHVSFVIPAPAAADDMLLMKAPWGMTILTIRGVMQGTTNVIGQMQECNSTGGSCVDLDSDITLDGGEDGDDGTLTDSTIAAGNWIGWKTTSVSGTPTFLTITLTFRVIPD